ncbi:MAG TPA: GrpB family protein, partial [Dermatophilaceae bacterium]|nr:GrpB family protein [Dermatophilaceae bacterium]
DPEGWAKRFHGSCDPANVAYVHVRASGSRGWEFALLFRDWLRASPGERAAYAAEKRRLLDLDPRMIAYVEAKEPWFVAAYDRAQEWARSSGWRPPGI